jgi:hypothetical protein
VILVFLKLVDRSVRQRRTMVVSMHHKRYIWVVLRATAGM